MIPTHPPLIPKTTHRQMFLDGMLGNDSHWRQKQSLADSGGRLLSVCIWTMPLLGEEP